MTTVRIDALKYDQETSRFYAAISVWDTRAAFDSALPPDEEQEFFITLPPNGATDRTPRKQGQRYVLLAGGTITQAELDALFLAYKRRERSTSPYDDLAYDAVPVDHAKVLRDVAQGYIAQQKANGRAWRGNQKGKGGFVPRLVDADPESILGKINVAALIGAVFDL